MSTFCNTEVVSFRLGITDRVLSFFCTPWLKGLNMKSQLWYITPVEQTSLKPFEKEDKAFIPKGWAVVIFMSSCTLFLDD